MEKVAAVLTGFSRAEIVHLTTGTSSFLFQSLTPALKEQVVAQVTASIRDTFIYLLAISSLGFILSFTLSVSDIFLFDYEILAMPNTMSRGLTLNASF